MPDLPIAPLTTPVALPGFDGLLGARLEQHSADRTVVGIDVDDRHLQPFGIVHGGVYCTLVESAASLGAAAWFGERGTVVGVANSTDFLAPVRTGPLRAVAVPVHRGRTQQLWQVEIHDADARLVARGQLRVANLARRDPADAGPGGTGTNG